MWACCYVSYGDSSNPNETALEEVDANPVKLAVVPDWGIETLRVSNVCPPDMIQDLGEEYRAVEGQCPSNHIVS